MPDSTLSAPLALPIFPFLFEDMDLRTALGPDGWAVFCGKDACEIHGIADHKEVLAKLDDDERTLIIVDTPGGPQEMIFITLSGLFSVIFQSRKPWAKRFRKWVTSEVLPKLMKHGFYGEIDVKQRLAFSKRITEIAKALVDCSDALYLRLLTDELRDLSNLIGRPMPDMTLLGQDPKQMALPLGGES